MGMKTAAISLVGLFVIACLLVSSQEKKAADEFKIPPEEAKRENPVKPTVASVADGKHTFASQCAMCHGKDGDGKGDLAEDMKLKLRDYRDPAAMKDVTDGEMFYILTKGKGDMPGQEDRMKPEQRWNLVNYIRSLSKGKAGPKTAESKPPSL